MIQDTELFGYIVSCIDDRPIRSVDLFKAKLQMCINNSSAIDQKVRWTIICKRDMRQP